MNTFKDFFSSGQGRAGIIETASSIEEITQLKLKQIAEMNLLPIILDKLFPVDDFVGKLCRKLFINLSLSGEKADLTLDEYFKSVQLANLSAVNAELNIQNQWRGKALVDLLTAGEENSVPAA